MIRFLRSGLRTLGICLAAAAAMAWESTAPAYAITWDVSGTFTDGGTFSGDFNIDQYGYLSSPPPTSITTTAGTLTTPPTGGLIPFGQTYSVVGSYVWTYTDAVEFIDPGVLGSQEELYIQFQNPIANVAAVDPILFGFECVGWSCGYPNPDSYTSGTRFILVSDTSSPSAAAPSTPLPPSWTMLIGGLLGFGIIAYRRRKGFTALAAWSPTLSPQGLPQRFDNDLGPRP